MIHVSRIILFTVSPFLYRCFFLVQWTDEGDDEGMHSIIQEKDICDRDRSSVRKGDAVSVKVRKGKKIVPYSASVIASGIIIAIYM